jgi:hypothetical protein
MIWTGDYLMVSGGILQKVEGKATPMINVINITALIAAFGLLLNLTVIYLLLSQGRNHYHNLFAGILLINAIWDLGILVSMLRNEFEGELIVYGYISALPCIFLLPLIFQFTCSYLGRTKVKTSLLLWFVGAEIALLMAAGKFGRISAVQHFSWGNFWQGDEAWRQTTLVGILFYCVVLSIACWMLLVRLRNSENQDRRHLLIILLGFAGLAVAVARILPSMGAGWPFFLSSGMLIHDGFAVLIGIAILKHTLFQPEFRRRSIFQG